MFEATLKNRSSAHFAPVTITFPIPEDQYEQAILALEKSQIGDARVQDCLIDNVHAPNCPALNRMTGTMANVDELDWLGKQLESFNRYELLQFNAAVERFGLSAADELIDLSFCAREVTVISDFSDLELVGKRHYLTVHGACDPKELENLDGKDSNTIILVRIIGPTSANCHPSGERWQETAYHIDNHSEYKVHSPQQNMYWMRHYIRL